MSDLFAENRGLLLQALHVQYPYPLRRESLERQAGWVYAGNQKQLTRDLAYLEDGGYLTTERRVIAAQTLESFKLTKEGVDLVEGRTTDPGIVFAGA